jgi:type I restriction enzyme S subunit
MTYQIRKISEIAYVKGGKRLPKGDVLSLEKTNHPYIRARDIRDGKITFDEPVYLKDNTFEKISRYITNTGDVCITIVGANVGDIGQVPESLNGANLTENSVKLIGKSHDYVSSFVKHALLSHDGQKQMKNSAAGTAQPKLGIYKINEVSIPYPDYNIQLKVSEVLDNYDNLIENNNRRIAILEDMAQSLYREWFVHFRYPGHADALDASSTNALNENQGKPKLIDSPLGQIPEGWEVKPLIELVHFKRNTIKKGSVPEKTPYMGLEHFPRKSIALSEWEEVSEIGSNKLAFNRGDILFGKIRPNFHKVGVAQVDGLCSSDAFVLSPKNAEHHALVAMVTFSNEFVAQAVQTSQGSKMPRASWDVLKEFPVPVPAQYIIEKFNAVVEPAIKQIRVLSLKNRNLKQQRDMLLPKLISGAIEL